VVFLSLCSYSGDASVVEVGEIERELGEVTADGVHYGLSFG
jgi:hypothetical protein